MLIGLTGGIGCGKSSAAKEFARAGCRTLDTDEIVKSEVLREERVLAMAGERWGADVLDSNGQLNRAKVADIIFTDRVERLWWEGIIHPLVGELWRKRVKEESKAIWVVEIPLLFEAGLEKGFDFIVCVGANEGVQMARAMARGLSRAQVGQRIASQLPLDTKLSSAHGIIWNDGDHAFLRSQVSALVAAFRSSS